MSIKGESRFNGHQDHTQVFSLISGNIQVEPESDFRLYCDPGTEGEINRCEWESPNGAICEFDRDNQEGDSCGGIEGVEFEGELDNGNGNCQIYVNDAREEIHDGTWKCSMKVGPTMYDYVNVEVSYDDDDDGLTPGQIAAIAVSCGLVFLALLILLLMCCLCPAVFDKCRGEKKEKNKKIYVHEAPRHHPPPPPPPQVVVETRRRSRSSSSSDEERRRNRRQNRKRSSSSSSDDRRRRQKRSTNQPEFITVTTRHDHSAATRLVLCKYSGLRLIGPSRDRPFMSLISGWNYHPAGLFSKKSKFALKSGPNERRALLTIKGSLLYYANTNYSIYSD